MLGYNQIFREMDVSECEMVRVEIEPKVGGTFSFVDLREGIEMPIPVNS
ncbi:hypothetical protein ACFSCX_10555 [Bacillus salitolerans]|uniref:Uncharacterized protein n=1 Tax=Bacillus salitolerans TaxID=1437434 RepID=A0ABW4LQN8_9BACI